MGYSCLWWLHSTFIMHYYSSTRLCMLYTLQQLFITPYVLFCYYLSAIIYYLLLPCIMISTMYYDFYHVLWFLPCIMISTMYYDFYHVLWFLPCIMISSMYYDFFHVLWFLPCIMISTMYYDLQQFNNIVYQASPLLSCFFFLILTL